MAAPGLSSITTVGVKTADLGTLREILLFKFEVAGAAAAVGLYLQMMAPQWRPYT